MKCLKAVKSGKYSNVGDIIRVSDKDAMTKVDSGYWMYVPKSEWKESTRKKPEIEEIHQKKDEKLKKNQIKKTKDRKEKNV